MGQKPLGEKGGKEVASLSPIFPYNSNPTPLPRAPWFMEIKPPSMQAPSQHAPGSKHHPQELHFSACPLLHLQPGPAA